MVSAALSRLERIAEILDAKKSLNSSAVSCKLGRSGRVGGAVAPVKSPTRLKSARLSLLHSVTCSLTDSILASFSKEEYLKQVFL